MASAKHLLIPFLKGVEVWDTGGVNTHTIDETGDKAGAGLQAPEAVTITHVGFDISAVTGTPGLLISLQGLDSTGVPTGTVLGGASPASVSVTSWTTGYTWYALANAYTTTRGEFFAIVVEDDATGNDPSAGVHQITIRQSHGSNVRPQFPTSLTKSGAGAWTKSQTAHPMYAYKSASRTYGLPRTGSSIFTSVNFGNTTENGVAFTLPAGWGATFQLLGVEFGAANVAATNTLDVTLYDSDGTTILQQIQFDEDFTAASAGAGSLRFVRIYFDEATLSTLNFGTEYFVGFAANAAGGWSLSTWDVLNAGDTSAFPASDMSAVFCTRTLTDYPPSGNDSTSIGASKTTTRIPAVTLILDDWTEPAAGAAGGVIGE